MKQTLTVTLIFFLALTTYAQQKPTAEEAENTIAGYLKEMQHWRKKKGEHNIDSVYAVNRLLVQFMSDIGYEGYTLNYDFKKLNALGMQVHTSDDHLCRTFCWEIVAYGSSHYYNYMITYYQSSTRAMSYINKEGTSMTDIYTIKTFDNRNVYLIREENDYDFKDRFSRLTAHVLKDGYFTLTNFFYNSGDSTTYAGYAYRLFSFADKEKKLPKAHLEENNKKMVIPIIKEGGVYQGDMFYKFDGMKFIYDSYVEKKKK